MDRLASKLQDWKGRLLSTLILSPAGKLMLIKSVMPILHSNWACQQIDT